MKAVISPSVSLPVDQPGTRGSVISCQTKDERALASRNSTASACGLWIQARQHSNTVECLPFSARALRKSGELLLSVATMTQFWWASVARSVSAAAHAAAKSAAILTALAPLNLNNC